MVSLLEDTIVYPPHRGYPLTVTAKRYYVPEFEPNKDDPNALTLICLHSTSFHKETWEPTLQRLFELVLRQGNKAVKVREAWAIEAPNHGTSTLYNKKTLHSPDFHNCFTCHKYAHAVQHFLSAGLTHGARIDFYKRNLVGIGHSLGGVAMSVSHLEGLGRSQSVLRHSSSKRRSAGGRFRMYLTILSDVSPPIPFSVLILVEPMLSPEGLHPLSNLRDSLISSAYERQDTWSSRSEALKMFVKRGGTQKWDRRVLGLFVKYGLQAHHSANDPVAPYKGVTLALSRDAEAGMYRDVLGSTEPVAALNQACAKMPVHLMLGTDDDLVPKKVHNALMDPKSGRTYASMTRIKGSGHLVPQEKPDALGNAIFDVLCTCTNLPQAPRSAPSARAAMMSKL